MPLLGGDSNSYWRIDIAGVVKAVFIILLIRGATLLMGIYPRYIPVFDDIINATVHFVHWAILSFNNFASGYLGM